MSVLPRWLPDDVWAIDAENVAPDFDARHSARRRWYRYALWRSGIPSADSQGRCLIDPQRLDLGSMREAASALLGRHDFGSFITKASVRGFTERTVFAADWLVISESLHVFEICADAFLKQMVRTIVGSLLWVGNGRWTAHRFATALSSTDRRAAGPNAPAVGLTLHRIDY